jgi:hypothetical protein
MAQFDTSISNAISLSVRFLCLILVVCTGTGCLAAIGAGAAAGGIIYYNGNLKEYIPHPVPNVHAAAVIALKNDSLPIYTDELDNVVGRLKSEDHDGKDISIHIEKVTREASQITIRIGATGDHERSEALLAKIKANL